MELAVGGSVGSANAVLQFGRIAGREEVEG